MPGRNDRDGLRDLRRDGGGANGTGLMIVAPGDPVPGVSGTDTVACGAIRWFAQTRRRGKAEPAATTSRNTE